MEMPRPNEHHAALGRFVGEWDGEETMHPSQWMPEGGVARGLMSNKGAVGGFCVVTDYRQENDGQVTFEGHGVFTVEPGSDEVVLHFFDSTGLGRDEFRGRWDKGSIALTAKNAIGLHRITYRFPEEGRLETSMESSSDGQEWQTLFDARYRREG